MPYQHFEDLPVWNEAARLYELTEDLLENPNFRRTSGYADQLDRAALSVSNNIAEGFERGTTNERLQFLYYAKGSAGEVRSMLRVKLRRITDKSLRKEMEQMIACAKSCARQLAAWSGQLQNSDIPGQRRLTDQGRKEYSKKKFQAVAHSKWNEIKREALLKLPEDHHLRQSAIRKGEL